MLFPYSFAILDFLFSSLLGKQPAQDHTIPFNHLLFSLLPEIPFFSRTHALSNKIWGFCFLHVSLDEEHCSSFHFPSPKRLFLQASSIPFQALLPSVQLTDHPQHLSIVSITYWQSFQSSCSVLPASIPHKTQVSKCYIAELTAETFWVPVVVHCLDNTPNNELTCKRKATP